MHNTKGYQLLDSGDRSKLERFGDKIISRPSSLCEWMKRSDPATWSQVDAAFAEEKPKGGSKRRVDESLNSWQFLAHPFTSWIAEIEGVRLELELMSNGQLGIFPEHALYLADLGGELRRLRTDTPAKVLNLFAYTGLATCFCAKYSEVELTHVDLSKRAIERARANCQLNNIADDSIRWIVDDALSFMAREARRGQRYDVIIIDPPSFSRVSKNLSWTLDEKLAEIMGLLLGVISPNAGAIFFTNHSTNSTVDIARNIALDKIHSDALEIATHSLALQEQNTERRLPAGSLIKITY